ncbi:MAG: TonB-dependent receptor [Ectothiorhodospiraceae bacterium]|jgi:vitamin B12 transporter|nr:TonB-dependent receptor [Ectothiorhodospiraceae bacterium]
MYKHFRHTRHAGLALLLTTMATPAMADDALGPILITTPTRSAQTVDDTVAPVVVITREDIERAPAVDAADLLQRHAGIELGRNGGFGQITSVFIRGANSNHTLVMIDGVRINPGSIGTAPLQDIDPAMIERIEVVKGPRSALWGSDAIGGVVNVITRRPRELSAGIAAGEHGSSGVQASAGGTTHDWRWGVSASHRQASGYPVHVSAGEDHGFRNTSLLANADGRIGDIGIEAMHWQANGRTEYWSFGDLTQDFSNAVTAVGATLPWSTSAQGRLRLTHMRGSIEQQEPNFLGEYDEARTERLGLELQHEQVLGGGDRVLVGAALNRETVKARSFGTLFDEDTAIDALFAQYALERGSHRAVAAVRHTEHEAFGGHFTWNVDYGYPLTDDLRLTLGAGSAFRAPDTTDRFGFAGNTDLDPETSRNVEAGLRYRVGEASELRATWFDNRIRDLILYDGTQMQNVERARIYGLELGWSWRRGPWSLDAQAVMQEPRNESRDEPLARRARRSATIALDHRAGRWGSNLQLRMAGERKDSSFNDVRLPGYGVLDAAVDYALAKDVTLGLRVENLFDHAYELAAGYPMRGRHAMLELRAQFGK